MRDLTLQGKITIFKSLAISKIVFAATLSQFPRIILDQLEIIQKQFLWNAHSPKIKHETVSNSHGNGGLKSVDISTKILSLQHSWVKRLYDEHFHEWKIIPLHCLNIIFGKQDCFHSHLKPTSTTNK